MTNTTIATTDAQAIEALLSTYERSLNSADAELAASLYAPDGVFMPLFLPTATGDGIVGSYRQIFEAIKLDIAFETDDLSVDGDVAHVVTRSQGYVTVRADGATAPESNRELFVFTRREGEWKIARYMFNKTSPAGA